MNIDTARTLLAIGVVLGDKDKRAKLLAVPRHNMGDLCKFLLDAMASGSRENMKQALKQVGVDLGKDETAAEACLRVVCDGTRDDMTLRTMQRTALALATAKMNPEQVAVKLDELTKEYRSWMASRNGKQDSK